MSDGAHCSKCDAPILWVATVNGKMQPLDREPNEDGNIRLTPNFRPTDKGVLQECKVITKAERESLFPPEGPRYMPHHATCPFAQEFRKPKPKQNA